MIRTGLVVGGLALVIGLLWWVALSEHHEPAPMPTPTTHAPDDTTPHEPAAPAPAAPTVPAAEPPPAEQAPPTEPPQARAPSQPVTPDAETPSPAPRREGPVDELKALFDSEPRDSAASQFESKIEAAFRQEGVPAALFKSVLCRQSVCKLTLRWAPERSTGYLIAMTLLAGDFDKAPPAVDPVEEPAADGSVPLDVYWPRPAALK